MATEYTLYGGDLSLFTGKARAYMRYKGLDFEELTATRELYKQFILPRVGAPIIPILQTAADEVVQDTTDIIDFLEARHPQSSVYPDTPRQRLVALMLEHYGDEWLVIPAMHYRWSVLDQQSDFIFGEFGRLSAPDASTEEQIRIGEKTCAPFRGSIKGLGITEETGPEIERVYLEFLDQLNCHFEIYPYLLGSRPSIGDYGFVGPLYAHLGRDPVPLAIMRERAPAVYAWVERMNAPEPLSGEFLPNDEVPDTLIPILETLCSDFYADVRDVVAHNLTFVQSNPGKAVPRYLGMHEFSAGSVQGQRVMHSYTQWMFQRAWDCYHGLSEQQRGSVDELLGKIGGLETLQMELPVRLRRQPGQLELVVA